MMHGQIHIRYVYVFWKERSTKSQHKDNNNKSSEHAAQYKFLQRQQNSNNDMFGEIIQNRLNWEKIFCHSLSATEKKRPKLTKNNFANCLVWVWNSV